MEDRGLVSREELERARGVEREVEGRPRRRGKRNCGRGSGTEGVEANGDSGVSRA